MTNYYENLDAIILQRREKYLRAYDSEKFIVAAGFLYSINASHPPDARLDDMPKFVLHSNSLRATLNAEDKAKNYCDHWDPLLEEAMSQFRRANQDEYNRI